MSTITSPRPSAPSTSIASTPSTSRTTSPAPTTRRANRSALRDYYNLKPTSPTTTAPTTNNVPPQPSTPITPQSPAIADSSPLDSTSFDPQAYITSILTTQPLSGVLKTESALINEIRALDGERKALVYDNYSKLITATDTIRSMREHMDPLAPRTGGLGVQVEAVAEMAGGVVERGERERKRRQRDVVRWVVGAPGRLRGMVEGEEREEAEREWGEVRGLLEKWEGVNGVGEVREECERVMKKS